ncbi:MAG: hypothetical protein AAGK37_17415 [Pseudomonadota bacterium]
MRPLALILLLLLFPAAVAAQDQPVVTVELEDETTIVGQPLIVRIKILVPTFSPAPPEFPSMEVPGVVVRLPERASGPVSEAVNGETWSGVQRSYRLYPLAPGTFEIPAQTVRVTYAEPGGIDPIAVDLEAQPIQFEATVPDGAKGLSPLIIATGFTLTQTLELPGTMDVGDAVERRIEATISGTTPILIPAILAPDTPGTLRAYTKEPRVSENEDRGVLSGQKVEAVTYLAVAPGAAQLPPVSVDWFNLETGAVETARVDGGSVEISGSPESPHERQPNWRTGMAILIGILVPILLICLFRRRIVRTAATATARWRESERYAARQVKHAIRDRDLSRTLCAVDTWSVRVGFPLPRALQDALQDVGAARFAAAPSGHQTRAWSALPGAFKTARYIALSKRRQAQTDSALPAMNPFAHPNLHG